MINLFTPIEKQKSLQLLYKNNILKLEHIAIIKDFFNDIYSNLIKDKKFKFINEINLTLNKKIGNTISAAAYSSNISNKDLKPIIYALCSLQLLADIGDTISDDDKSETQSFSSNAKLIKNVYSFDSNTFNDSQTINILKENISFIVNNSDKLKKTLFNLRWEEFIQYQICSVSKNNSKYLDNLNTTYFKILNSRSKAGFILKPSLKSIEYVASKGGTTYLLNLLRNMFLNIFLDFKNFDKENTFFDYLNFASDHVEDIATDNGYQNLEDLSLALNGKYMKKSRNAVHLCILRDLKINNLTKDNANNYKVYLKKYFLNIIKKTFKTVKSYNNINYLLIKPMIYYFFMNQNPSKEFATIIINYVKKL